MVGSLVTVLLQVFSWFWQWNNFESRLIFDEVKAYKKDCAIYFGPPGMSGVVLVNFMPDTLHSWTELAVTYSYRYAYETRFKYEYNNTTKIRLEAAIGRMWIRQGCGSAYIYLSISSCCNYFAKGCATRHVIVDRHCHFQQTMSVVICRPTVIRELKLN